MGIVDILAGLMIIALYFGRLPLGMVITFSVLLVIKGLFSFMGSIMQ